MNLLRKSIQLIQCTSRLIWIAGILSFVLSGFSLSAQNFEERHKSTSEKVFLFLIDSSSSMSAKANTVSLAIADMIEHGVSGLMDSGDTFLIWIIGNKIQTNLFKPMKWRKDDARHISNTAFLFLQSIRYGKTAKFDSIFSEISAFIRKQPQLILYIVSDGAKPINGTPFDKEIYNVFNLNYSKWQKEKIPVITAFVIENGIFVDWAIGEMRPLSPINTIARMEKPKEEFLKPIAQKQQPAQTTQTNSIVENILTQHTTITQKPTEHAPGLTNQLNLKTPTQTEIEKKESTPAQTKVTNQPPTTQTQTTKPEIKITQPPPQLTNRVFEVKPPSISYTKPIEPAQKQDTKDKSITQELKSTTTPTTNQSKITPSPEPPPPAPALKTKTAEVSTPTAGVKTNVIPARTTVTDAKTNLTGATNGVKLIITDKTVLPAKTNTTETPPRVWEVPQTTLIIQSNPPSKSTTQPSTAQTKVNTQTATDQLINTNLAIATNTPNTATAKTQITATQIVATTAQQSPIEQNFVKWLIILAVAGISLAVLIIIKSRHPQQHSLITRGYVRNKLDKTNKKPE